MLIATAPLAAEPDRAAAEQELEAVVARLNALDKWFSDAERRRVRWLQEVRDKDREVAEVSAAVDGAEAALAETRAALATLEEQRRTLAAERSAQARLIADHLAAAYRLSGQDFIKVILNQESPDTIDRMMRYHRHFSEARLEALARYQETLAGLEANARALEENLEQREQRQRTLARRAQSLVEERDERKRLLAQLDVEAENKTEEQQRLDADRERLESLIATLIERAQTLDGGQFLARKGALPWPLKGPLRSTFGQPRAGGRLVWHGMVVAAEAGEPVRAVFRGRVIFADWLRGFGLLTILDHGSGLMTLYGHADALHKRVGEWVESGEVIARAGRSGGQSATGLYFEVRQNGRARDPLGWLAQR